MTNKEKLALVDEIIDATCGIFNGIADEFDEDSENVEVIEQIETKLNHLRIATAIDAALEDGHPYQNNHNALVLRDREDGEVTIRTYINKDVMMRDVSRIYCFSDCYDDTEVLSIIYNGREVYYTGWQPGMVFEYKFVATKDEAWSGCYPNWDH